MHGRTLGAIMARIGVPTTRPIDASRAKVYIARDSRGKVIACR